MAEMKYYKIIFIDGEEWNCYTEDNREYKSHGIMWSSSLTKPSIPVLEPLETMIEPNNDSNVGRMEEIEPREYWGRIEDIVNSTFDEDIKLARESIEEMERVRIELVKQIEGKW